MTDFLHIEIGLIALAAVLAVIRKRQVTAIQRRFRAYLAEKKPT